MIDICHTYILDSFGIYAERIQATENRGSGVMFSGIRMPVSMSLIQTAKNTVGLHLYATASFMNIINVTSIHNKESGVFMEQAEGMVTASHLNISYNKVSGILYQYGRSCSYIAVSNRFSLIFKISSSLFMGNNQRGLYMVTTCRIKLTLNSNIFKNSAQGISCALNYNQNGLLSYVTLHDNSFRNMSSNSFITHGYSSINTTLQGNIFMDNQYRCVHASYSGRNSRTILFYMHDNVFTDNITPVSLIYISVPRYRTNKREYVIKNNNFSDNSVDSAHRFYLYSLRHLTSVVYLNTGSPATIKDNIFMNPQSNLQLSVGDTNPNLVYDASFNYWGSVNVNDITNGIYAFHQQIFLAKVKYWPYYASEDLSHYNNNSAQHPDLKQGNNVGGLVTLFESLMDTSSIYTVTKDIVIAPEGTLVIGPGVTLQFEYGIGILVHGLLEINGNPGQKVILTALQGEIDKPIKLVDGPNRHEGFVQVFTNNSWHALCYSTLITATLDLLCAEAGSGTRISGNKWKTADYTIPRLSSIACTTDFDHCTVGLLVTTCNKYQYMVCNPRYWSGIHLAVDAKPCTIRHATISFYGVNTKTEHSGLLIDYLDHDINNIKLAEHLNYNDVVGIRIKRINAQKIPLISNITVAKITGHGLVSSDSRFWMAFSSFSKTSSNHYGVYIKQQMVTISTLRKELMNQVCFADSYALEINEVKFLHVTEKVLLHGQSCSLNLTTQDDYNIAIQVVSGNVPSCGPQTLIFYDGNFTQPVHLKADSNGMIWTSIGNDAHIIMHRTYYDYSSYYYGCLDIVVRIWTFKGKNKSLYFFQFHVCL